MGTASRKDGEAGIKTSYSPTGALIGAELGKILETGGIDPPTSHMLSERSTIWATSPACNTII